MERIRVTEEELDLVCKNQNMFTFEFSFGGRDFQGVGYEGALNFDKEVRFMKLGAFFMERELVFVENDCSDGQRFCPCSEEEYEEVDSANGFYIWFYDEKYRFKRVSSSEDTLVKRIESASLNWCL